MTVAQITSLWEYYERSSQARSEPTSGPQKAASMTDLSQWLGVPVERSA